MAKKVISSKKYHRIYEACANLYGIITDTDLHALLKHYHPTLTKTEVKEDMKKKHETGHNNYIVWKSTLDHHLFVAPPYFVDEDIDKLLDEQEHKPYYVPPTEEDLLRYADPSYSENKEEALALAEGIFHGSKEPSYLKNVLAADLVDLGKGAITIHDFLQLNGAFFDEDKLDEFLPKLQDFANNSRCWANCGYTPMELKKLIDEVAPMTPEEEEETGRDLAHSVIDNATEHDLDLATLIATVMDMPELSDGIKRGFLLEFARLGKKAGANKA